MRVLTQPRIAEKFHVHAVCSPACFSTVVLEYMRYIYKTENELFFLRFLIYIFSQIQQQAAAATTAQQKREKETFFALEWSFWGKNYVYILSVDNFFNPLDDEQEDDEEIFI